MPQKEGYAYVKRKGNLARYLGVVLALALMVIGSVLGNLPARGNVTAWETAAPLPQITPTSTPVPPKLNVSPTSSLLPNDILIVTGTGFTTGGSITIASITIGGVAVPVQKINDGSPVKVDSGGNFGATVIIPVNTTTLTSGSHAVSAFDSSGRTASTTLTIQGRFLKVDPETSRRRSSVTVTGTGFPVSSARPGADPSPAIQILYEITGRNPRTVANTVTNLSGEFTASFIVLLEAPIPSTNTIRAVIGNTSVSETKTHSVPDREIKITPESGPPGTSITVTGSNFPAFSAVRSLTMGRIQVLPSPAPSTNAEGSFTARVVAPELEVGTQAVEVEVGDSTALVSFRLTAPAATPVPAKPTTPAALLAPLGTNLVRVWGFDSTKQAFQLYDPAAPVLSDLTDLLRGGGYWVLVNRDQKVTLGSSSYNLNAGWNLIGWLG